MNRKNCYTAHYDAILQNKKEYSEERTLFQHTQRYEPISKLKRNTCM